MSRNFHVPHVTQLQAATFLGLIASAKEQAPGNELGFLLGFVVARLGEPPDDPRSEGGAGSQAVGRVELVRRSPQRAGE